MIEEKALNSDANYSEDSTGGYQIFNITERVCSCLNI